ncbi:hypothetical protein IAQ61_009974 [Plenodomus lingam]|uniref:uncharacterized protein n=1 Tax=Leptosphaeria maculans TaxID=5022 RepID=UPI00332CE032|nr:hypothetical protein IAQ61_009974 [Plenodomus lingam]
MRAVEVCQVCGRLPENVFKTTEGGVAVVCSRDIIHATAASQLAIKEDGKDIMHERMWTWHHPPSQSTSTFSATRDMSSLAEAPNITIASSSRPRRCKNLLHLLYSSPTPTHGQAHLSDMKSKN